MCLLVRLSLMRDGHVLILEILVQRFGNRTEIIVGLGRARNEVALLEQLLD